MPDSKTASGVAGTLGKVIKDNPATQRLLDEVKDFAVARATGWVKSLEQKLGSAGEGGGAAAAAAKGAEKLAKGENPVSAGLGAVASGAKEKGKSLLGGRSGGGSAPKMTNIIEDIDIGMPVSVVYNQWTQFEEFSSFMKGIESVDRDDEDVESTWRMKVFLSRRTHNAKTIEQIPDRRIVWQSDSDKGSTKGVVTFHPLADDLTRVLVVLEYYPGGFFEKTANLWRAPGRRARLDLKHFRRFVTMRGEETGSWRGEIRDSEIVRRPEESEESKEKPEEPNEKADESEDKSQESEENSEGPAEKTEESEGDQPPESGEAKARSAEGRSSD